MKKQPSTIGKQHSMYVNEALKRQLNKDSIVSFSEAIQNTVSYIMGKYPTVVSVKGKYDFSNPDDKPDLTLTLNNGETININLFSLKGSGKIQPKNLGAKSFISKYFQAEEIQQIFNEELELDYKVFLKTILETKEDINLYDSITMLKKKINKQYPSFSEEINPIRTSFLFNLRERLFELLHRANGFTVRGLEEGFKELMLLDSVNIITRHYEKNKCSAVEEWSPILQHNEPIQFYKKGNDTVGIRIGQTALTLRLKFESAPTSSLKLATSFDIFPVENERQQINKQTLRKLETLLNGLTSEAIKTDSNAVGKCNEALVYASFIAKYPTIYQVDPKEFITMYKTYAPKIKEQAMRYLQTASAITVDEIGEYLKNKYGAFQIVDIQLVPQNYIKNRLDTADLQLTLKVGGKKVVADFSLKAAAKVGSHITMKNPGVGTILGSEFFGIGTLSDVVENVKQQYVQKALNHKESLEEVSLQLGTRLQTSNQLNLQKGLTALLGKAPTVVTFYEIERCVIKEHGKITTNIEVEPQTPTPINTLLKWNNGQDRLKLRLKFSAGQSKGWSSLKLACEYTVK